MALFSNWISSMKFLLTKCYFCKDVKWDRTKVFKNNWLVKRAQQELQEQHLFSYILTAVEIWEELVNESKLEYISFKKGKKFNADKSFKNILIKYFE